MSSATPYPTPSIDANAFNDLTRKLRIDIIRMIAKAGNGHPGGSLSAIDLIAALYLKVMRHDPKKPELSTRDRFVLSKGHGVPALYAVLAHCGYFDRKLLSTLRELGSPLQGHPVRGTVPGIESCTGSLGQGLSVAQGLALAQRLDKLDAYTFCLMGDGEIQEGQVWEAAMSAAKFKLDNLVAIVDFNKAQIDGLVSDVMPLDPIVEKWRAFGWKVERIDGHNIDAISKGFTWAQTREGTPKMLIADTIKGKGVSFMEKDLVGWHGVATNAEQTANALKELGSSIEEVWP